MANQDIFLLKVSNCVHCEHVMSVHFTKTAKQHTVRRGISQEISQFSQGLFLKLRQKTREYTKCLESEVLRGLST